MNPDLSVVVPVYNEEEGLAAAVRAAVSGARCPRPLLRGRVRRRRQQRPLGRAAARAVPTAPRRDARGGAGAQRRAAHGDSRRLRPDTRHLCHHPGCGPAESARGDRAPGGRHGRGRRLRRHHPRAPPGRPVAQGRLAPHEPHPRRHDLDPHHRPGLHAARLPPQRDRRGEPLHRGEHLRAGARVHLRAPPGGDRGDARGAHGRAVEVLALPADPPELRPDDRLLGGAAAVLLHDRRVHRA